MTNLKDALIESIAKEEKNLYDAKLSLNICLGFYDNMGGRKSKDVIIYFKNKVNDTEKKLIKLQNQLKNLEYK